MNAAKVPLVEVVLESQHPPPPSFKIGTDDNWMVEWRRCKDDDPEWPVIQSEVSTRPFPFLVRTRDGWYIEPDPLHSLARRLIAPTVSLLIFTLLIHSMEPGLVKIGLLSDAQPESAGTYVIEIDDSRCCVKKTTDRPDVVMAPADLSAMYLGGVGPGPLFGAGRIKETTAGSLLKLTAMFNTDSDPWCAHYF